MEQMHKSCRTLKPTTNAKTLKGPEASQRERDEAPNIVFIQSAVDCPEDPKVNEDKEQCKQRIHTGHEEDKNGPYYATLIFLHK